MIDQAVVKANSNNRASGTMAMTMVLVVALLGSAVFEAPALYQSVMDSTMQRILSSASGEDMMRHLGAWTKPVLQNLRHAGERLTDSGCDETMIAGR